MALVFTRRENLDIKKTYTSKEEVEKLIKNREAAEEELRKWCRNNTHYDPMELTLGYYFSGESIIPKFIPGLIYYFNFEREKKEDNADVWIKIRSVSECLWRSYSFFYNCLVIRMEGDDWSSCLEVSNGLIEEMHLELMRNSCTLFKEFPDIPQPVKEHLKRELGL